MYGTFYGWYLKCQSDTQTLAVIFAIHGAVRKRVCSIQIVTEDQSWVIPFSADAFHKKGKNLSIGNNQIGEKGFRISINEPELTMKGRVEFGPLSSLRYDIMGPFSLLPFLECRHRVWSMRHSVRGTVYINDRKYSFRRAVGYWEGDQGRSFPKVYAWTQCFFTGGSLMLSVADIPIAGFHFNGVIGVVLWQGREYRLATYLGARAVRIQNGMIRVVQGDMSLEARLLKTDAKNKKGHPLKAPTMGNMERIIHESVTCQASYRFRKGKHTLFAFKTNKASFEYEY